MRKPPATSSLRCTPPPSALLDLFERPAFDLERQPRRVRPGSADGGCHSPGHRRMVLLDQDRVVETAPVVEPATGADRLLLQQPQTRHGLARIEDPRAGAGDRPARSAAVNVAATPDSCWQEVRAPSALRAQQCNAADPVISTHRPVLAASYPLPGPRLTQHRHRDERPEHGGSATSSP